MTQEELADAAGLSFTYVGQIERGVRNPTLDVVERISRALKADVITLIAAAAVAKSGNDPEERF